MHVLLLTNLILIYNCKSVNTTSVPEKVMKKDTLEGIFQYLKDKTRRQWSLWLKYMKPHALRNFYSEKFSYNC